MKWDKYKNYLLLNQAKELHVRSLDIYLKKLGPEHVDVAMCYDNLGLLHRQMGNLNQAKACQKRALDVCFACYVCCCTLLVLY